MPDNIRDQVLMNLKLASASFVGETSDKAQRRLAKDVLRVMQEKLDTMPDLIGFTIQWTGSEVKIDEQHRSKFDIKFIDGVVEVKEEV